VSDLISLFVDWLGIAQNKKTNLLWVSVVYNESWLSACIIWPSCRSFSWIGYLHSIFRLQSIKVVKHQADLFSGPLLGLI